MDGRLYLEGAQSTKISQISKMAPARCVLIMIPFCAARCG
jgi:hypothetical protein